MTSSNIKFIKDCDKFLQYIWLELRCMSRNKRLRAIYIYPIFLTIFTMIMFFDSIIEDSEPGFIISALTAFAPGFLLNSLGILTFSKDAAFYDAICTLPINRRKFVSSKYLILQFAAFSVFAIFFLINLAYFVNLEITIAILIWGTFYIGIYGFAVLFGATLIREAFNYSDRVLLNYQGMPNWKASIPPLLFVPFIFSLNSVCSYYIMVFLSVLSLFFRKQLLQVIIKYRTRNKYSIIKAFKTQ